jgi:hypothetical protein
MTGSRAFLQNLLVNSLAIVTDPQTEQVRVVLNCSFDPVCVSMPESVSQYLASNPVNLVLKQRRQGSRLPFHDYLEDGRWTVPILGVSEFLTHRGEQIFQAPLSRPQA